MSLQMLNIISEFRKSLGLEALAKLNIEKLKLCF